MSCAASAVMTEGITSCFGAGAEPGPKQFHQQLLDATLCPKFLRLHRLEQAHTNVKVLFSEHADHCCKLT